MATNIIRRFSNGTSFGNREPGDSIPDIWHLYNGNDPISTLIDSNGEIIGNPGYLDTTKNGIVFGLDRRFKYDSWYDNPIGWTAAWRHSSSFRDNPSVEYYYWSNETGNILLHKTEGRDYNPIELDSLIPSFSISDLSIKEGESEGIRIHRTNQNLAAATITLRLRSGSATPGDQLDYNNYINSQDEKLRFKEGELEKTIRVFANSDNILEGQESFYLDITSDSTTTGTLGIILSKESSRIDIIDTTLPGKLIDIITDSVLIRPNDNGEANLINVDYRSGSLNYTGGNLERDLKTLNIKSDWRTDLDSDIAKYEQIIEFKINNSWKSYGQSRGVHPGVKSKQNQYSISEDKKIAAYIDANGFANIVSLLNGKTINLNLYGCDPYIINNRTLLLERPSIPSTSGYSGNWGVIMYDLKVSSEFLQVEITPTYTLTPSSSSINEGSTLTTSIATKDVASGTTLYYSVSGTGINTSDFSSGSLTGSGTVGSDGSFSFSHTLANDLTTEGTETLSIKLFSDSNRLIKIGETNVSIVDYVGGSTDYSYSLSKLSGLTSSISLIGAFENFQFYNLGGNRQGIQKKGTGAIDEITGISTLTFNDSRISVSDSIIGVFNQVTGKETKDAQMFRLYNASFNRFPDSDGLKYWINEYSKGITDYRNIAESFIISSEFKQRYGASNTNLEFATNMYKNILGRLPDAEGLNYWVSNLNAGTNSRVDVLGGFSESVENKNLFSQVTGFV